jgi:hypothetical protein
MMQIICRSYFIQVAVQNQHVLPPLYSSTFSTACREDPLGLPSAEWPPTPDAQYNNWAKN